MKPDDELCLCFHVSQRKVATFLRVEKPRRVGQIAECFGAGTGCGWCRPFLGKMFAAAACGEVDSPQLPGADQYASERSQYVRRGGGTPPAGASPVE